MLRKDWFGLMVLAWVVALSLGQILPASAQDAVDTAADVLAATEIITEVTVMLGTEGAPLALPSLESTVPGTEEAVQVEEKTAQPLEAEYRLFLPTVSTASRLETGNEVSAAYAYWHTLKYESFEGVFPNPGWTRGQCTDGYSPPFAEELWGKTTYKKYGGSSSVWATKDGSDGKDPYFQDYGNKACSWMAYGPFKLSHALMARMRFMYWNVSSSGDYFSWMARCTGKNWSGVAISGNSGGWKSATLDLGNIPGIGSCVGTSADVWIAFQFMSDLTLTAKGPFVDDVVIEEYLQYSP